MAIASQSEYLVAGKAISVAISKSDISSLSQSAIIRGTTKPGVQQMIVSKNHAYFTPEDYLELEHISPIKHEYIQGQVVAMAGASKAHVIITGNLSALLVNYLRGKSCIPYATDMKVRLPLLNLFYYPDLAVTCDDRDRISNQDYILYPKLIIEVLSDSTEAFDRGDKFADYKSILEFEEYILIHQKQILVERFLRKSNNLWVPHLYHAGDDVEFSSIGFSCAISNLYENIAQLI
jgi:Uma2 family endonuclease